MSLGLIFAQPARPRARLGAVHVQAEPFGHGAGERFGYRSVCGRRFLLDRELGFLFGDFGRRRRCRACETRALAWLQRWLEAGRAP